MTLLSVNINKIATLRNSRGNNLPDLLKAAKDIQSFGAQGITIHPRPDERHIKYSDALSLKEIVKGEFNIEGNPIPKFIDLVLKIKPEQVTLVPDKTSSLTSDSGWDTVSNHNYLKSIVQDFKKAGIRTSIFVDPDPKMVEGAFLIGADRIELYTEYYSINYIKNSKQAIAPYISAAKTAKKIGLGVNAGHDLNLENIEFFSKNIPGLIEVSIGHALICESLYLGFENVIPMYLNKILK
jgi:pyridoxine 5-phosphate synthase